MTDLVSQMVRSHSWRKMETGYDQNTHISCLFPEILAMIFRSLDVQDKGSAARVCVAWRDAAYNRLVWKGVVAKLHLRRTIHPSLFPSLIRRGIKRVQILSLKQGPNLREVIVGIPNLESLDLNGCYNVRDAALRNALQYDVNSLTTLNLSLCKQITDQTLQRIAQYLKKLEVLELGGCTHVTSNGLLQLSDGLHRLRLLNLRSCRCISDQGMAHLAGLNRNISVGGQMCGVTVSTPVTTGTSQLEKLVLQDCQKLTDQALKYISVGLLRLQSLNLSFCASVTDSGLKFLAKMPLLRELNLRSCDNVSDIGVGFLAEGGSRITSLDVSFCERIGDQALVHISQGLFHLQTLSLCACSISDDSIGRLSRSSHDLTTLNIGQCGRITDKGLHLIAQYMKNLRSIDLYGCTKITTVGLEKIMQLQSLKTLNLGLWQKR